jgi:hypothetical protein
MPRHFLTPAEKKLLKACATPREHETISAILEHLGPVYEIHDETVTPIAPSGPRELFDVTQRTSDTFTSTAPGPELTALFARHKTGCKKHGVTEQEWPDAMWNYECWAEDHYEDARETQQRLYREAVAS